MAQADAEVFEPDPFCAGLCPPVEVHFRLAAALGEDLDLSPRNAAHPCAQGLHDSLLTSEAHGQFGHASATESDLLVRIDAPQKPVSKAVQRLLHAVELDDIYAHCMHGVSFR